MSIKEIKKPNGEVYSFVELEGNTFTLSFGKFHRFKAKFDIKSIPQLISILQEFQNIIDHRRQACVCNEK